MIQKKQTQRIKHFKSYSTLKSTVVQYNSWRTESGIKWTGKKEERLEEREEVGDDRAEGSSAIVNGEQTAISLMPLVIGHAKACFPLWKFTTWRFICRSSVQSLSCVRLFVTPWTTACQASLSMINSRSPPKPMSIESVMPSNHLILCRPRLFLPSIFPSIRVFPNESALHIRWPKYWSFSISPSNEHPGLISFRTDWLDLLAVQGTLKSLLQHHSSKILNINSLALSFLYSPTLTWLLEKQ